MKSTLDNMVFMGVVQWPYRWRIIADALVVLLNAVRGYRVVSIIHESDAENDAHNPV